MHRDGRALSQNVQVRIGHQGGDFDNAIALRIQPCHLKIDPNEVVFICTHAIFHPSRVTIFI